MEEHDVGEELIFNADQSALYFKRFSCTTMIEKQKSSYVNGTESMRSKYRIT